MKKPPEDLITDFHEWYRNDRHSDLEDAYTDVLTGDKLGSMDKSHFIDFFYQFAKEGGKIQSGGARTAALFRKTIEDNYPNFRDFILQPFKSDFSVFDWLGRISEFPYLGDGLSTIYLNRIDKYKYAIINNKSVDAMELFDVSVPFNFIEKYKVVHDTWSKLIEWYPEIENYYRADSIAQFLLGEDAGSSWAGKLSRNSIEPKDKRYWIYAPGPNAKYWDEFYRDGVMGIGWVELDQDLRSFRTEDDLRQKYHEVFGKDASEIDLYQLLNFSRNMKVSDVVFAKKGIRILVGFGEITSDYYYDDKGKYEYKDFRRVNWLKIGEWHLPDGWTTLPVKTLTELTDQDRVKKYFKLMDIGERESYFTERTFTLLDGLHENPTADYYRAHREEFIDYLQDPFRELMSDVRDRLEPEVHNFMETEKGIFSKIVKNDFGRGGAWDFYWSAFYPKGGKRIEGAQLFVSINHDCLHFGFSISDFGVKQRVRFRESCIENKEVLIDLLSDIIQDDRTFYSEQTVNNGKKLPDAAGEMSFEEWIENIEDHETRVINVLQKEEVLSSESIADQIADLFNRVFPLVYLVTEDEPLESIRHYLGTDEEEREMKPPYTLTQCAEDTLFDPGILARWVRAIERKKQAIFYGPPGTGKTFVSEKIAKHIVSEGDGFIEVVQFHPSYAYEDFMQGLRPRKLVDGGLEYAMVPGRFKEFCRRARLCKNRCVLIIDEINRANLSRVLGELMYLLEYRDRAIPLAGGEVFQIPKNVRIIGTMNTADRSIALVDHALRRRFAFLGLYPNYKILRQYHQGTDFDYERLIALLQRLNAAIDDRHYYVGISYFLRPDIKVELEEIWISEIQPYIEELFFDQPDKADSFAWERIKTEIEFE